MDTIENNAEPVGSDGATSSPDTSAQVDTQTATTETPVSDGTTETTAGEAQEKLLAGKYGSPEELERAYKELEGKLGTLGQKAKAADLIQEKYGVTPEALAQMIANQEAEARRQQYADNPLLPVLDKVSALEQKIQAQEQEKALMAVDTELDSFVRENEVYAPFKDQLRRLALTEGIGFDANGERSIEELADEYFGKAIASGQNSAYKKIEVKKNTQTTGVVSTPKKGITLEDMKNMSAAEMRAVLMARQSS